LQQIRLVTSYDAALLLLLLLLYGGGVHFGDGGGGAGRLPSLSVQFSSVGLLLLLEKWPP
jgi:hypothetical protein